MKSLLFFALIRGLLALGVLNAAPAGFDAASVRVNNNGPRYGSIEYSGNRLTIRATSLWMCIRWAWRLESFQISGPDWLQTAPLYDIVATTAMPVMQERMRAMLRILIGERFGMKTHTEKREMRVMALMIAKGGPKLRPSSGKFDAALGPEASFQFLGFDSGTHMQRTAGNQPGRWRDSFTNMSMRELASVMALGFSKTPFEQTPVIDRTGLTDRYDFALTQDLPSGDEHEHPTSDDVLGDRRAVLQREIGLTLESRKADVEVLVIDHVNREPRPN
jgi:uncharacterized protein (TIGR03435 family)